MRTILALTMSIVLLSPTRPSVAEERGVIRLTAIPSTVRAGLDLPVPGADHARIASARNEVESFQVVVRAKGGTLANVNVSISEIRSEDAGPLPAKCVTIFREVFIPVRMSARRATRRPGFYPDPLVPQRDPITGQPVAGFRRGKVLDGKYRAVDLDLWKDQNLVFWFDVAVPREAAADVYRGTVRVTADGAEPAQLPVEIEVWDFTLPDGPTHENHFGGVTRAARRHGVEPDSETFHKIEHRYFEMLASHRINPPLPHWLRPTRAEDGSALFDSELDKRLTEFVRRFHVTNIEIPRSPFGGDREKTANHYRSWYAYLEKKGWADRSYLYMLDEPNDAEAYERVRQLGASVHEAEPRLRRLVVEQPYAQNLQWPALDEAIDIWCPLFGFIHEPSIQRVQAAGDEVWSYTALVQPAPPYHPDYDAVKGDNPPYWQIDFPVLCYRIAPWLNRRYGITGLLYWSVVYWDEGKRNPWEDPGFRIRFNGEGALLYPGTDAGIEGPVASIRLKNLRDGMEDYEYFALAERRGGKQQVEEIVREAVPTWGSWDQNPGQFPQRRRRLAEVILNTER